MDRASSQLESVIAKALHRTPPEESPLLAWPVVCGSAVSERTQATSFSAGILQVEVLDPRWKQELESLAPRYVAQLNRYAALPVNRIDFVVRK